jgi:hypothetical protein
MKTFVQILMTTCAGFAMGCALMHDDPELMWVAGLMSAVVFFATYLILFVGHMIYKRSNRLAPTEPDYLADSLLGFDGRGTLKIESVYLHK